MTEERDDGRSEQRIAYDTLNHLDMDEVADSTDAELDAHFTELAALGTAAQLRRCVDGDPLAAIDDDGVDLLRRRFVASRMAAVHRLREMRRSFKWLLDEGR
jgi:hypothetical protein